MMGRMDDGGHHLRDTQTQTDRQTQTDTDARTFFSRDLMVCRGRFTIGPFGAIKSYVVRPSIDAKKMG